jgi:prepilin-type N-terminal cleavage/methylation domain-containing protein
MNPVGRRHVEGGFSLPEVLVSLLVVAVTGAALGTFFVASLGHVRHQGQQQTAAQFVLDGLERARAQQGGTLLAGRVACGPCPAPVARATTALAGTVRHDAAAAGPETPTLPLPAHPETLHGAGNLAYQRYFHVGRCWRAADGSCGAAKTATPFYRVVVAVTWPARECAGSCTEVGAGLFAADLTDPLFKAS